MCDHAGLGVRSCVVAWSANVCCIPTIPLSRARLPRPPGRYKADQAFLVGQDKSPVGAYLDVEVSAAAVAVSLGLGWVGLGCPGEEGTLHARLSRDQYVSDTRVAACGGVYVCCAACGAGRFIPTKPNPLFFFFFFFLRRCGLGCRVSPRVSWPWRFSPTINPLCSTCV